MRSRDALTHGRAGRDLEPPRIDNVGPAAVWWIPRPAGPRISLAAAIPAWPAVAVVVAGAMLWARWVSAPLWPFGRPAASPPEVLMRYVLIFMVCLGYLTVRSVGTWWRLWKHARRDAEAIEQAVRDGNWVRAGLHLHRYALLVSEVWRRLPPAALVWDGIIRPRLAQHRRVYVYYSGPPPALPPDPAAGFAPVVVTPPGPSPWTAVVLVPVGVLLYTLVTDILRQGQWQRAVLFNAVLLVAILMFYGSYFLLALLGRSGYLRFAPGLMQVVRFGALSRRPEIRTCDLRRLDLVLNLTSRPAGLTLVRAGERRLETYALPRDPRAVEAVLRAALSAAASPPLPGDRLVD